MKDFLIEHIDGDRWLSEMGWIRDERRAFRFSTEGEANQHIAGLPIPMQRVTKGLKSANKVNDVLPTGAALADYDPWGLTRGR